MDAVKKMNREYTALQVSLAMIVAAQRPAAELRRTDRSGGNRATSSLQKAAIFGPRSGVSSSGLLGHRL